jgi:hypothetical protein
MLHLNHSPIFIRHGDFDLFFMPFMIILNQKPPVMGGGSPGKTGEQQKHPPHLPALPQASPGQKGARQRR